MGEDLSNREIAERLTLTPGSVKWYTKQIYAKTGSSDRRQVLARARESGLLKLDLAASLPTHNLPALLTSCIGRERQIEQVSRMITDPTRRLVTLTGAGGVGKTRLALQVAEEVRPKFAGGVWLVELAALSDGRLLAQAVAKALGLDEDKDRPPLALLLSFLRTKKLLLVLDDCEHLIEACASLVDALLRACPGLHILATSRDDLDIAGEVSFIVPSLSFPDPSRLPAVENLAHYEAVRLFVERARIALPGYEISQSNAQAIARICRCLDGIPLALELAAARLNVLDVEQIADRLDGNFKLLAGDSRTAWPRHKTMRASIEWSYNLLSSAEQILLQRLSVFMGGWTLAAAETVCAEEDEAVINLLSQLVDKSLVQARPGKEPEVRFSMLQIIRQFALEKLADTGEDARQRARHLDFYLKLGESAEPRFRGRDQVIWLDRLTNELNNLRSALTWALQTDPDAGVRLTSALMWFWHLRGRREEGIQWLQQGLSAAEPGHPKPGAGAQKDPMAWILAKGYGTYGFLLHVKWENEDAREMYQKSLKLLQVFDPKNARGMAFALYGLGGCACSLGDFEQASRLLNDSLDLYAKLGDQWGVSECLLLITDLIEDPDQAIDILQEVYTIKKEHGDLDGMASALQHLSQITFNRGDIHKAAALAEESQTLYRKVGNKELEARILYNLGLIPHIRGDYQAAFQLLEAAFSIYQDTGNDVQQAFCSISIGDLNISKGDYDEASLDIDHALEIGQETDNKLVIGSALLSKGRLDWIRGDRLNAAKDIETALALGHETGYQALLSLAHYLSGLVALSDGDLGQSSALLKKSLQIYQEARELIGMIYTLEALAVTALRQNKPDRAARLWGAAHHPFSGLHANIASPTERNWREEDLEVTRLALGDEHFMKHWQEGVSKTLEQAVDYALGN